jgi:Lrp/AsnC family transcriptional regulator of ectoine degradation
MKQTVRLDRNDLRILDVLHRRGRVSNAQLAREVGLSESACFQRVKRLEQRKVITGYKVIINTRLLGPSITVLTMIDLDTAKQADYRKFDALVAGIPEIVECNLLTGQYDYALKVIARDLETYTAIIEGLLEAHGRVKQYYSYIVMRQVKSSSIPASHFVYSGVEVEDSGSGTTQE